MPKRKTAPQLLTKPEVRARLAISKSTVTRWRRAGIIVPVSLPSSRGMLRYRAEDVAALVDPR